MPETIASVAASALKYFTTSVVRDERGERTGRTYVHTHHSPKWVDELVRDAHGELLPEDVRYEMIRDALDAFAEMGETDSGDLDDYAAEWADQSVDVYTHDLLAWLCSSGTLRLSYCDEYASEIGAGPDEPMEARIRGGQYMERREVAYSVLSSLRSRVADLEG